MGNQWQNGEFNPAYGAAASTTEPVTQWPTPEEQRQDLHWTARVARPKAGDCADFLLAGRQEAWDESEAKRLAYEQGVAERRAERESAAAQAKAQHDAEFAAREAKRAEQLEADARARYLAAGGANWEEDRDAVLQREVLRRMESHQSGALISPAQMLR